MTAVRTRRSSAETRELVLDVAADLFYGNGIRATGIDRVAAVAGVAPTTLYRLYASKDDLVAAYLEHSEVGYLEWLDRTARSGGTARERVLAVFDQQAEVTAAAEFRGCPFLMALAEFPDPQHPAHVRAIGTKAAVRRRVRELVEELATEGPVRDRAVLADQLMLVMEGVYAAVSVFGDAGPAQQARGVARALLDAASR